MTAAAIGTSERPLPSPPPQAEEGTEEISSFRGGAKRRTRNPDGFVSRVAIWIPGSREDARPEMTRLG
jgi:hypothetical protein